MKCRLAQLTDKMQETQKETSSHRHFALTSALPGSSIASPPRACLMTRGRECARSLGERGRWGPRARTPKTRGPQSPRPPCALSPGRFGGGEVGGGSPPCARARAQARSCRRRRRRCCCCCCWCFRQDGVQRCSEEREPSSAAAAQNRAGQDWLLRDREDHRQGKLRGGQASHSHRHQGQ
ncbi:hypothetical protein chiPu_0025517, partial [Chiloscyllium punctatum]|nr:hypothetical protein [Chiloscyllium punctatum]